MPLRILSFARDPAFCWSSRFSVRREDTLKRELQPTVRRFNPNPVELRRGETLQVERATGSHNSTKQAARVSVVVQVYFART